MKLNKMKLGKVVIEKETDSGNGYMVMYPDGEITWEKYKRKAGGLAKKWFKNRAKEYGVDIGVGEIEWRQGVVVKVDIKR